MARLIDPSVIVRTQHSTLNEWVSENTLEARVVLLLPANNPEEQALALQILQLQ